MQGHLRYRVLIGTFTFAALVGCDPGDPSGLEIGISPTPPIQGTARVIITADSLRVSAQTLLVEGRPLESAPPRASVQRTAHRTSRTTFVVDSFPLATAGPWRIIVRSEGEHPVADSVDVRVVGNPGSPDT